MKAYFAGGCFWCITPVYKIYGVDRVTCGYSGGDEKSPSYKDVKSQLTGHRETLELEYDPAVVSYEKLAEIFLANIDPFDGDGQYIDRGRSYSPAIYYTCEDERETALGLITRLEAKSGRRPMVALEPFRFFCPAEDEHQDYYLKNPEKFREELEKSGRTQTA